MSAVSDRVTDQPTDDPQAPRYVLITPTGYHDQLDLMARFHTLFGLQRLSWAGEAMVMTEQQARQLLAGDFPDPAAPPAAPKPSPPPQTHETAPPAPQAAPAPAPPRRTEKKGKH